MRNWTRLAIARVVETFIERVRRLEPEPGGQVPAAAITALASDENRHVAQPIDATELAALVRELTELETPAERMKGTALHGAVPCSEVNALNSQRLAL